MELVRGLLFRSRVISTPLASQKPTTGQRCRRAAAPPAERPDVLCELEQGLRLYQSVEAATRSQLLYSFNKRFPLSKLMVKN